MRGRARGPGRTHDCGEPPMRLAAWGWRSGRDGRASEPAQMVAATDPDPVAWRTRAGGGDRRSVPRETPPPSSGLCPSTRRPNATHVACRLAPPRARHAADAGDAAGPGCTARSRSPPGRRVRRTQRDRAGRDLSRGGVRPRGRRLGVEGCEAAWADGGCDGECAIAMTTLIPEIAVRRPRRVSRETRPHRSAARIPRGWAASTIGTGVARRSVTSRCRSFWAGGRGGAVMPGHPLLASPWLLAFPSSRAPRMWPRAAGDHEACCSALPPRAGRGKSGGSRGANE